MKTLLPVLLTLFLTACADPVLRPPPANVDTELQGTWLANKAELAGKNLPLPPGFVLIVTGDRYAAGKPNDFGKLVYFGDELAGQARRMDVVGEDGPNKGKRFPAIYRISGRELEICYDLSGKERPADFVSREGTMILRVSYAKK
ncbi:MAG: TIGR03067 domain-containing protein [Proteobacteria bacterium]|nr:TIGR03067 domain-containing protein [Pseudomonadota bacterium]